MTRVTTIVVIVFMLTSLVLAMMYSSGRSVASRTSIPAPIEEKLPAKTK
jgi:preprotein translocase subunit SecG